MPDWITHISVAYIIAVLLGIKINRSFLYIGAIIPDLFRLFFLMAPFTGFLTSMNFFAPLHTVTGVLLSGALVTSFFKGIEWKHAYGLVLLGAASHFVLDALMWPFGQKVWTFYPFWISPTYSGIVWPDSFVPAVISGTAGLIVWRIETSKSTDRSGQF